MKRGPSSEKARSAWGQRIWEALDGRSITWLSEQTGISDTTLGSIIYGAMPKADNALKIAHAIETNVEYLFLGCAEPTHVSEATSRFTSQARDTDYYSVPIVDGLGIGPYEDTDRKQPVVAHAILPRIQLQRLPAAMSNIWLVAMPEPTMSELCAQGDLLICQTRDAAFSERGVYIYEFNGIPTVRRVKRVEGGGVQLVTDHPDTDPIWAFWDGPDGTGPVVHVLARVAGAIRVTPAT